jgi:cysteine desulfurase
VPGTDDGAAEASRPGDRVYLDTASGLPLHPAARGVLEAALDRGWADPLRLHREGRETRLLLDNAREVTASLLGCRPDEVSFVSSGTTACHLGVLGLRRGRARTGQVLVHSAVEHSAVLHACLPSPVEQSEAGAVPVGVDRLGRVDLDAWREAVAGPGVAAGCLQSANHEVGTTQPLAEAHDVCRSSDVPLLVDAAASIGWADVPDSWDVLAASAHKWGGPAGIGVLAVRKGVRWRPPWPDDEREPAMAGYVDVPRVLAAAAALQAVEETRAADAEQMRAATTRLREAIVAAIPDVDVAGDPEQRLPHIVNVSCLYVDGEALVTALDRAGFAVSSGSACTASALEPSHVLAAMGVLTHGNVRVSVSPRTSEVDLERFTSTMTDVVADLRASTAIPNEHDRG